MAYISRSNPCAFQGSPSPWGLALAAAAADELAYFGGQAPFFRYVDEFDEVVVIVPDIKEDCIVVFALFAPNFPTKRLKAFAWLATSQIIRGLKDEWRDFGDAFVTFEIDPRCHNHLHILDHDGKVRAVAALRDFFLKALPPLSEFDDTLGTKLADQHKKWLGEVGSIHTTVLAHVGDGSHQTAGA